jgi:sugar-specific transcriptional regulator TrmB
LLNKYKAIASDEIKEKRRIKLQEELDKLDK